MYIQLNFKGIYGLFFMAILYEIKRDFLDIQYTTLAYYIFLIHDEICLYLQD